MGLFVVPTDAQKDVPGVSQVEVSYQVTEVKGHEAEAKNHTDPFLTSFSWKNKSKTSQEQSLSLELIVLFKFMYKYNWSHGFKKYTVMIKWHAQFKLSTYK